MFLSSLIVSFHKLLCLFAFLFFFYIIFIIIMLWLSHVHAHIWLRWRHTATQTHTQHNKDWILAFRAPQWAWSEAQRSLHKNHGDKGRRCKQWEWGELACKSLQSDKQEVHTNYWPQRLMGKLISAALYSSEPPPLLPLPPTLFLRRFFSSR